MNYEIKDLKNRLEKMNNRLTELEKGVGDSITQGYHLSQERKEMKKIREIVDGFNDRLKNLERFENQNHKRLLDIEAKVIGKPVKYTQKKSGKKK